MLLACSDFLQLGVIWISSDFHPALSPIAIPPEPPVAASATLAREHRCAIH